MSLQKDLNFGKKYEKELMRYIIYENIYWSEGCFHSYDIAFFNFDIPTYFEVKADRMMYKTGNIAIEFFCGKKYSGISTTRSDYYAIFEVIGDKNYNLYIIPTEFIKNMISQMKYKRIVNGGDYYNSKMYLFDKSIFSDFFFDKSKCYF